jgi:hypothetical protein
MEFTYSTHIDLRTGDPELDYPAHARSWGPERRIRAEAIRDLLVGRRPVDQQQEHDEGVRGSPSVFLSGARITGQLDLRGIHFDVPLLLQGCAFDEPLVIADSISCSIRIYGCHLPGVQGDWLKCTGDLHLRDCQIKGKMDLGHAYIGGQFVLSGSLISNPGQVAVYGDGLAVAGDMFCRSKAVIEGEVRLVAARIGGELRFTESTLRNQGGVALRADRITVEKDMYCREGFTAEGEVRLANGQVKGQLNFNKAALGNPGGVALCADRLVVGSHLYCQDEFTANGEIKLVAARVGGEVSFSDCTLSNPGEVALCADRLNVADDMYCGELLTVEGEVSLRGAHIKGQLNLNHATLRNPERVALDADRLVVGGHLYCQDKFTSDGMISLVDAHVNGALSLSTAMLKNPGRVALLAPRLIVGSDMLCHNGFFADGAICLIGAHIGGELSFTNARLYGASLTNEQLSETGIAQMLISVRQPVEVRPVGKQFIDAPRPRGWRTLPAGTRPENPLILLPEGIVNGVSGMALIADGLHVDIDMTCDAGFAARGEIRLKGVRIRQNLDFSDADVENQQGTALNAEDVQAERLLMPAMCRAGRISLRNGRITEIDDKRGVRPDQIDISGLSYEMLAPPLDPETRLEWLARNDYEPQPYDQLARSYRSLGYDESARKVMLAQERRRREGLQPGPKIWGYLQDVTIGYGYLPYRAAALFVLVVAAGVVWFWRFSPMPLEPGLDAQFNPFFYTLDVLVPFADFGQRGLWRSTPANEIFKVLLAVYGWTLALTAIAGFARRVARG